MPNVAVSFTDIGKRYRISHEREPYGRLSESITQGVRGLMARGQERHSGSIESFWALRDVTFDVRQGEVLGIIGRNGAGKTTLLKILSRITEPTTGRVELRGHVSSLLEVGTGFHMELTGRENIHLSGAILGMRRSDIRRRFDEIVDFAEVERFLDTPVKRYSSGMLVRLGFAVAAHLEPEVLVVDEVLAVGDATFRRKCLNKMEDVSHEGRTVLFVSHSMPAVESLCTRGVLLEQGSIRSMGAAKDVVNEYAKAASDRRSTSIADRTDRQGDGRLRIVAIDSSVRTGADSSIRLRYEGQPGLRNVEVNLGLFSGTTEGAANLSTRTTGTTFETLPASGEIVCELPRAPLVPGSYSTNVHCTVNGTVADWILDAATLEVHEGDYFGTGQLPPRKQGHVLIDHRWRVTGP